MRFRYLLWDMDGTLFDTYPGINRAVVEAFAEFGAAVARAVVPSADGRGLLHRGAGRALRVDEPAVLTLLRRAQRSRRRRTRHFRARCASAGADRGGRQLHLTHRSRVSLDRSGVHGMADLSRIPSP
jgi:beta-phosphoglucomutase-like phosphatase (HAD superfamily)